MQGLLEILKECRLAGGLLCVLAVNIVYQISVASVIYTVYEQRYYFYTFLVLTLMAWTLFFAWHALVKENAFELPAFLAMSSLMNFHGIYMLAAHQDFPVLSICTYIVLSLCQLTYLILFPFAYSRYSANMVSVVRGETDSRKTAYKLYESFMSLIKLDFALAGYIYSVFMYYTIVNWAGVAPGVCSTASLAMIAFLVYFAWGVIAAASEHKSAFVIFMMVIPAVVGIKMYFTIAVILSPGTEVDSFVLVQLCVFGMHYTGLLDAVVMLAMVVVGICLERTFGKGLKEVLLKTEMYGKWKPLL